MILSLQPQKADSFRFAPPSRKTGVLKAFWGYVRSSEVIDFIKREKRQKHRIRPSEVHGGYTEISARRPLVIIDGDVISPNGTSRALGGKGQLSARG